jgi:hypothetical protein
MRLAIERSFLHLEGSTEVPPNLEAKKAMEKMATVSPSYKDLVDSAIEEHKAWLASYRLERRELEGRRREHEAFQRADRGEEPHENPSRRRGPCRVCGGERGGFCG